MSRFVLCRKMNVGPLKEYLERDIIRAMKKMQEFYRRDSWCLCHGNLGNEWIYNMVNAEESEKRQYDHIVLMPQEKENPGLMNGYGGILYYLLKKTGYEVPNILGLEF